MRFVIAFLLAATTFGFSQASDSAPSQRPNGPPAQGDRRGPRVGGSILAISSDSITLKAFDGRTVTVKLTESTRYRKDQQDAKLSDFKVGDMVMARGEKTGEDTFTASAVMTRSGAGMTASREQMKEMMGKKIIAGEIKSIDGLKLTILRPDGETQTIAVDESTSFRKQGESITLADIKPGDHVFGRGELKDGVFVPSTLNVGQPGMRIGEIPPGPPPAEQH